jgi:hypothetical protein
MSMRETGSAGTETTVPPETGNDAGSMALGSIGRLKRQALSLLATRASVGGLC